MLRGVKIKNGVVLEGEVEMKVESVVVSGSDVGLQGAAASMGRLPFGSRTMALP